MNVVLYGATGKAGSRILTELLSRHHHVTAVVRNPDKLTPNAGLTVEQGDLNDASAIAEAIGGADAVVSAYAPPAGKEEELVTVTKRLIDAVREASQHASSSGRAPRLVMVGGAASLEVAPGVTVLDSGKLPAEWRPIAEAHSKALELLRRSSIDWTYLSPSAFFAPGERTGNFRLGQDELLTGPDGQSSISMEDYAIALVDELEHPQRRRQRFTVGY
jgi:putative NADH-flavin reductase